MLFGSGSFTVQVVVQVVVLGLPAAEGCACQRAACGDARGTVPLWRV